MDCREQIAEGAEDKRIVWRFLDDASAVMLLSYPPQEELDGAGEQGINVAGRCVKMLV
jgi:hypothetical protein